MFIYISDLEIFQMKKLKLYLAHGFGSRHTVRKIEKDIEKNFNIDLINPFYDVDRTDVNKLDKGIKLNRTKKDCQLVRNRDLKLIRNSDGVLAICFEPTIGTFKEICYAYEHDKKVFFICYNKYARNHLWNVAECYLIFKDIHSFMFYLRLNGYERKSL